LAEVGGRGEAARVTGSLGCGGTEVSRPGREGKCGWGCAGMGECGWRNPPGGESTAANAGG
jgi:hypothetical protein